MNTPQNWQDALNNAKGVFDQISKGSLSTAQEMEFVYQAFNKTPKLRNCVPISIYDAMINVASIGITLSPVQQLAYLVPRTEVKNGPCICKLDISYKGLIKLATDTGSISWVKAELVRENDNFEWKGVSCAPIHRVKNIFDESSRGVVIGGYCIAEANNVHLVEIMSINEMNDIQRMSFGPVWKGVFGNEMRKKAIIKRASKTWPKTNLRFAAAVNVINQHEGINFEAINFKEAESKEPQVEYYSDEKFEENSPIWILAIKSGKKTAGDIINTVQSLYPLTEEQKKIIIHAEEKIDVERQLKKTEQTELTQ